MKTSLTILFMFLLFSVFAQDGKNFIDQNYIEVTGKGEMEISPDKIYIQIIINENDNKGKESVEILEKKMLAKLQTVGIDLKKDFSVKDINSNFKKLIGNLFTLFNQSEFKLISHQSGLLFEVHFEFLFKFFDELCYGFAWQFFPFLYNFSVFIQQDNQREKTIGIIFFGKFFVFFCLLF